ncbi:MAG TPA: hypothetical protein VL688_07150 [Verrucomicrobiae bacterium]|jgi:hypothetical protein|nr:hypothetical protein [Verrucomicrobiae bacterium]
MELKTFWELSDCRNIFKSRYWKTGLSFWPVHLFSLMLILVAEGAGLRRYSPAIFQFAVLVPINAVLAGAWLMGHVLHNHPAQSWQNLFPATAKLFAVALVPALSLTLLLTAVVVLSGVFVGAVPDYSLFSYVFGIASMAGILFLVVALIFIPYGVAAHRLYLNAPDVIV